MWAVAAAGRTHRHLSVGHSPGGQRATSAARSPSPRKSSSAGRKGAIGSEGTGWHTLRRANFPPWLSHLDKRVRMYTAWSKYTELLV